MIWWRALKSMESFLDILHNFICFSKEITGDAKILAAYHQYFAVKKAVESTRKASADGGDGRGGVFWHTQGSGKSLSMVFYAKYLQEALNSPTIVVITDRNDLDGQLFAQFSKCKDFLRQTPVQAEKRRFFYLPSATSALTASISAACVLSFCSNAFRILSSTVPSVTI